MVTIIRPIQGRVSVRLPFQRGSANYRLLQDICGDLTRPNYDRGTGLFTVSRAHLDALINQLPNRLGQPVEVVLHGSTQTTCVSRCWGATRQGWSECTCSCAGSNHGTGRPLPVQPSADLSVAHEYTVSTFIVRPHA